jgi:two-component system, OmpR family, sensor kinase
MNYRLSMFWRIFLALWLGSTVLMIGSTLLIAMIAEREVPQQVRQRVTGLLESSARSLMLLHGRIGDDEFRVAVETLQRDYGLSLFLIGEDGREALGRPLPARLRALDARLRMGADTLDIGGAPPAPSLAFAEVMRDARGRPFRVMVSADGPPMPSMRLILGNLLIPLAFSILIAALFSALAARYLVKPIDYLRLATRRFASGELDHRVGATLQSRHDEFSALAGDFDRMADRIGELLSAQRRLMLDLSHELRSPLARLRVALELMRNQPQSRLLDRMERDADRMDVLIGELLLLARLESLQASLPESIVDLRELVSEIVDDARLEIAGQPRRVQHTSPPDPQPLQVKGDHELLRRAIENVVRNALQYSPHDADVRVSLERDGEHARIRVTDGGVGFSADALARVFAPFARGDAPDQPEGYGLGLAIARAAIQRHGGTIEVGAGRDAQGAEVVLRLPLTAA